MIARAATCRHFPILDMLVVLQRAVVVEAVVMVVMLVEGLRQLAIPAVDMAVDIPGYGGRYPASRYDIGHPGSGHDEGRSSGAYGGGSAKCSGSGRSEYDAPGGYCSRGYARGYSRGGHTGHRTGCSCSGSQCGGGGGDDTG